MDLVHIHLILNHVPVIGMPFGLFLLVLAFLRKSDELKKVSLGIFVLLALVAIPVYFSGEPAEELVKNLPGVSESIMEKHEDAAKIAIASIAILGIISLTALTVFRHQSSLPAWIATLSLVIALVTAGLMAYTGNLGGQIRHTEIRSERSVVPAGDQATESNED